MKSGKVFRTAALKYLTFFVNLSVFTNELSDHRVYKHTVDYVTENITIIIKIKYNALNILYTQNATVASEVRTFLNRKMSSKLSLL